MPAHHVAPLQNCITMWKSMFTWAALDFRGFECHFTSAAISSAAGAGTLLAVRHWISMLGSYKSLVSLLVGGIVPGDELMAVNGRILIDATLTEGQNSLARAWNSGGV